MREKEDELRRAQETAKAAQDAALRKHQADAEAARQAEQRRIEEDLRAAAAREKTIADERMRAAALALKAEEEAKQVEAKRQAAAREAEDARQLAEIEKHKKAEDPRRTQEEQRLAALHGTPSPAAEQKTLIRAIQTELRRVGCDPGEADGQWGAKGKAALEEFAMKVKASNLGGDPTPEALQLIVAQKGRVCPLVCSPGSVQVNGTCLPKLSGATAQRAPAPKATKETDTGTPHCYGGAVKCNTGGRTCTNLFGILRCN